MLLLILDKKNAITNFVKALVLIILFGKHAVKTVCVCTTESMIYS